MPVVVVNGKKTLERQVALDPGIEGALAVFPEHFEPNHQRGAGFMKSPDDFELQPVMFRDVMDLAHDDKIRFLDVLDHALERYGLPVSYPVHIAAFIYG